MSIAPTTTVANSGMALPIVFRFVWKELRRMRGFAAGVAVLTLGVMDDQLRYLVADEPSFQWIENLPCASLVAMPRPPIRFEKQ